MNNHRAAACALLLAGLILSASLVRGHSARSTIPPDLSLRPAGGQFLPPLRAANLLLQQREDTLILDFRREDLFRLYHLPGSLSGKDLNDPGLPGRLTGRRFVLVVGNSDEEARELATAGHERFPKQRWFALQGGVRAWYLAFELPVALFRDDPTPAEYEQRLALVRHHLLQQTSAPPTVLDALAELARLDIRPDALYAAPTRSLSGGTNKKISGGCE